MDEDHKYKYINNDLDLVDNQSNNNNNNNNNDNNNNDNNNNDNNNNSDVIDISMIEDDFASLFESEINLQKAKEQSDININNNDDVYSDVGYNDDDYNDDDYNDDDNDDDDDKNLLKKCVTF
jgi:hypothetical protein